MIEQIRNKLTSFMILNRNIYCKVPSTPNTRSKVTSHIDALTNVKANGFSILATLLKTESTIKANENNSFIFIKESNTVTTDISSWAV